MHDEQTNVDFDLEALEDPGAAAFQMCGLDLSEVVRGAYHCNGLGPDFWSRHNDFFQAILMFHCIGLAKNVPGPDRAAFTHATSRRITALADAMDAEPALKEVFQFCASQCAKTADRSACTVM